MFDTAQYSKNLGKVGYVLIRKNCIIVVYLMSRPLRKSYNGPVDYADDYDVICPVEVR